VEIILLPSLERMEISKFLVPASHVEPDEKIKCLKCGFVLKG